MPASPDTTRRGRAAGGAVLALAATVVAVVGLLVVDRLLGLVIPSSWLARSLLFPANVEFAMTTPEFSCEVRTNEYGFRGGRVPPPSRERVRIVAIGDSFTYGWGVEVEDAWPAKLQDALRDQGVPADVFNLGSPGAGPNEYADVAERVLPVLQPSIVIVGLLQGDDLMQSVAVTPAARSRFSGLASRLVPTLVAIVQSWRESMRDTKTKAEVLAAMQQPFRDQAAAALTSFTPAEKQRYDGLDAEVRQMFESGALNPSLVALAIRTPDYFMDPVERGAEQLAPHSTALLAALQRIESAAARVGARTLAAGIPYPFYVNQPAQRRLARLGFRADESAIKSLQPNQVVEQQVLAAGFDGNRVRDAASEVRDRGAWAKESAFFFPWDNHLTKQGHAWFGSKLAEAVRIEIARRRPDLSAGRAIR